MGLPKFGEIERGRKNAFIVSFQNFYYLLTIEEVKVSLLLVTGVTKMPVNEPIDKDNFLAMHQQAIQWIKRVKSKISANGSSLRYFVEKSTFDYKLHAYYQKERQAIFLDMQNENGSRYRALTLDSEYSLDDQNFQTRRTHRTPVKEITYYDWQFGWKDFARFF